MAGLAEFQVVVSVINSETYAYEQASSSILLIGNLNTRHSATCGIRTIIYLPTPQHSLIENMEA